MTDEDKLFNALNTLKEYCNAHYCQNGPCDCPCICNDDCAVIKQAPLNWQVKKKVVFL